jgi:hypothetical protein
VRLSSAVRVRVGIDVGHADPGFEDQLPANSFRASNQTFEAEPQLHMTGIRTLSVFTVVAALAFLVGRGGSYPSDIVASLQPDGDVMRRLQIVLGRPSALLEPESEDDVDEAVPPSSDALPGVAPVVSMVQPLAAPPPKASEPPPVLDEEASLAADEPEVESFQGLFSATERANLRRAPGRDGGRLGVVREGEQLEVTGRTLDGEWYRVRRGERQGYVASDLVRPLQIDTPLGMLDFAALEQSIDELDELLRAARFEQVVATAQRLRVRLWTARRFVSVSKPAVRIESAAGIALIALGRTTDAQECFTRALQAEPTLELDAKRFSPKVMRAFEQARTSPFS